MTEPQPKPQPDDEPKGSNPPRSYQVLIAIPTEEGVAGSWGDFGLHPGANPQAAIKRARGATPQARKLLADGAHVVAVPESYFEALTLTVEVVEKESFKPVKR